jgi:DNA-binding SARP family transcriptional activator
MGPAQEATMHALFAVNARTIFMDGLGTQRPPMGTGRAVAHGAPVHCADSVPALTVQLIDGFRLWVGTRAVHAMPTGKIGSLLKLLVLHRQRPLSRSRLCALYWPEADPASARNNLNVSLHRLRRLLGDAAQIRFADDAYQLVVQGDVWVDAEQFEMLAEHGAQEEGQIRLDAAIDAYEDAALLYQTDLVPDIDADAALGAWAQGLRDRLNQVLTRLATLRENSGDLHGCLRTTLRSLALDECNEAAHRQLMRCYARLHQPQEVERQYRRCVSVLRLQLGLGPSAETTAQYRKLVLREAA